MTIDVLIAVVHVLCILWITNDIINGIHIDSHYVPDMLFLTILPLAL